MNGRAGVDSHIGKGSTFWIELKEGRPRTDSRDSVQVSFEPDTDLNLKLLVLCIEDSPSHATMMEIIINDIGNIELHAVHGSTLGLELAGAHIPDIILSNICLPSMDGYELLEPLKNNNNYSRTTFIAISKNIMTNEDKDSLLDGIRRYFSGPIGVAGVSKGLRELIDNETAPGYQQ